MRITYMYKLNVGNKEVVLKLKLSNFRYIDIMNMPTQL